MEQRVLAFKRRYSTEFCQERECRKKGFETIHVRGRQPRLTGRVVRDLEKGILLSCRRTQYGWSGSAVELLGSRLEHEFWQFPPHSKPQTEKDSVFYQRGLWFYTEFFVPKKKKMDGEGRKEGDGLSPITSPLNKDFEIILMNMKAWIQCVPEEFFSWQVMLQLERSLRPWLKLPRRWSRVHLYDRCKLFLPRGRGGPPH